jgi:GT2 family glycosyltransferase
MTALLLACAATVAALTAHTAVNATLLRRPRLTAALIAEPVAVLLPARDEATRVGPCVRALLAQRGVRLTVVVVDDGSTDGTAEAVRAAARDDPRLTLVAGTPPPAGWLGKPHACAQAADFATRHADPAARALVFVDADVILAPDAVAAAVALLREARVDMLSPYPRILAASAGERLVQPLLQWSWLTFLPLRAVERSARPSLAAAGGQFLVVDADGYRAAGGHAAVRDLILDDVGLARAVKRAGGRVALADGSALAECRMYSSWRELADGYGKSLWAAFGSPAGAAAVVLLLLILYAVPLVAGLAAAAAGDAGAALAGGCGYLLAVAGRVISARATGGRALPDALAHPVSVGLLAALVLRSFRLRRRAALSWKGRPLPRRTREETDE